MSDENQRLQELYQTIGFKPTPRLHQVLEAGLSEAYNISREEALVTVPFLILGILFVGRHRPQNLEFATGFYNAIGSEETDKITKRVRQFHPIASYSEPVGGMHWISSDYFDILNACASSNSETISEISPEDAIVTLLEKRPKECRILFEQHIDVWDTLIAATQKAVKGLPLTKSVKSRLIKLTKVAENASVSTEKNNPRSSRPPSDSIQNWRLYLKSRYGKQFTDGAIQIIISAVLATENDRGNPNNLKTVNTKRLLVPLALASGPLRTLHLEKHTEGHLGIRPWHEPQIDKYESDEARKVYGKTIPSVEFAAILQGAATLADTTMGFPEVTEWHLAFAAISSSANGIKWQLHAQKSSLASGAIVLRRNLASRQPQLEPLFNWSDLEDDSEPYAEEGVDESQSDDNSKKWSRAFHNLRKPKDFRWSASCVKVLDALWHSHGTAVAFARQSKQRAKRFNPELTARSLFLACLRSGASADSTEASSSDQDKGLFGILFRSTGKTVEQLDELLRNEFHSGRDGYSKDSDSPLVSEGLAATIKLANEIRLSTGSDPRLSSRHLVVALLHPFEVGGTGSRVLLSGDEIDPTPLITAVANDVTTAPRGVQFDDPGGWLPWLQRLEEGMTPPRLNSRRERQGTQMIGGKTYLCRGASDKELCLNIDQYSAAIGETLDSASEEEDFVFALYGPWGRGKTKLARAVEARLKDHEYTTIFFSAWKYPSRPEVWVHLYQEVSKVALEGDWRRHMQLSLQVGILRHGWPSLIIALGLLALSRLPGISVGWLAHGLGIIGILMLLFFAIRTHSAGRSIYQRYLTMPDHAEKLGLQAVVGSDLSSLLKVWVAPPTPHADRKSQEKFPPSRIDFSKGGSGRLARNWAISLFVGACGLLIWQVWTAEPMATHKPIPAAIAAIKDGTSELTAAVKSLEFDLHQSADAFQRSIVKIPNESVAPQSVTPTPTTESIKKPIVDLKPALPTVESDSNVSTPYFASWCQYFWAHLIIWNWPKIIVTTLVVTLAVVGWWFLLMATRSISQTKKILLVVDDLDRCDPDQMLAVIESIRMFLDDPAMSARMQVMMLLDLKILELALKKRCRAIRLPHAMTAQFIREQRDKWFVAELALPPLSKFDIENAVNLIVDREANAAARVEESDSGLEPNGFENGKTSEIETNGMNQGNQVEQYLENESTGVHGDLGLADDHSGYPPDGPDTPPADSNISIQTWSDDLTYHPMEREEIKRTFVSLKDDNLTPRRIRSLTLRYQLSRLILRHLGMNPAPRHILACLIDTQASHDDVPEMVRMVVQSVS